jgi:uncharacterized protein (DUF952 family)
MACIFKVITREAWEAFSRLRVFDGSAADKADGFIHFSTAAQLPGTLAKHYAGQTDLVLVALDPARLPAAALKWEPARDGALFPHLYDLLAFDAVIEAAPLAMTEAGAHALPAEVMRWG